MMENTRTGQTMTYEEYQEHLRIESRVLGKIVLCSWVQPEIGDVQPFGGLPMRCVRYVSNEEAMEYHRQEIKLFPEHHTDIDPDCKDKFHFEVVVAD
jgi:hypothetical protein